jgi:hypothetical protein
MTIRWDVTPQEFDLINKIVQRALDVGHRMGRPLNRQNVTMDITAVHKNGNPLRLAGLLGAKEFDFTHDVFGILRHINRKTGQLENCFSPRYSL